MPIYPAREEPIPGITSDALLEKITSKERNLIDAFEVVSHVERSRDVNSEESRTSSLSRREGEGRVILTIGAGDIDRIVEPLKNALLS